MLKYPEVVKNIDFIKVSTISLEFWSVIIVNYDTDMEDGAYFVAEVESFSRYINQDNFRLRTEN